MKIFKIFSAFLRHFSAGHYHHQSSSAVAALKLNDKNGKSFLLLKVFASLWHTTSLYLLARKMGVGWVPTPVFCTRKVDKFCEQE